MRKLLYVPVIHMDPDLGKIAPAIDKRSAEICGKERWAKHKQTIVLFWNALDNYFKRLDPINLKIYQDGLMAEDELGQRIIEEGAKRGSKNYEIVLDLIRSGGEIRKTEDITLLKEEYNRLLKLAQTNSSLERTVPYIGYSPGRDELMEKRDAFIARSINETLKRGETGVLFIGAYHDVLPCLATDIVVQEIKKSEMVRDYFKELISNGDMKIFTQLADYLASPVVI